MQRGARRSTRNAERGYMFFAALWAIVGTSILMQAGMVRVAGEVRNVSRWVNNTRDFELTEGLLDHMLALYKEADYSGPFFGGASPVCPSDPVQATSLFPACGTIASCCKILPGSDPQKKIFRIRTKPLQRGWLEVHVTPPVLSSYRYATGYGITDVVLRTGAIVDGTVQTNGTRTTAPFAVDLNMNATVTGQVTIGPGGSTAGAITTAAGASIFTDPSKTNPYGCTTAKCVQPGTAEDPMPTFPQDTGPAGTPAAAAFPACSNGSTDVVRTYCIGGATGCADGNFTYASISAGQHCNLTIKAPFGETPTDLVVSGLVLGADSKLNIQGNVRIKSTGTNDASSFNWGDRTQINLVNTGGTSQVVLYSSSDVRLGSTGVYGALGSARYLEIKLIGANDFFTGSGTKYRGKVYAPMGTATLMGDAAAVHTEVHGTVIANHLIVSTDARLYTDVSIEEEQNETMPTLDLWYEVDDDPLQF